MRERKSVDTNRTGSEEERGGVEVAWALTRIYSMTKSLFSVKGNSKHIKTKAVGKSEEMAQPFIVCSAFRKDWILFLAPVLDPESHIWASLWIKWNEIFINRNVLDRFTSTRYRPRSAEMGWCSSKGLPP